MEPILYYRSRPPHEAEPDVSGQIADAIEPLRQKILSLEKRLDTTIEALAKLHEVLVERGVILSNRRTDELS